MKPKNPEDVASEVWQQRLHGAGYVGDENLSLMVGLAADLQRPLLIEGPAGSGKTYLATALAKATGRQLVRLSCYEGIDAAAALYDWNYHRQLAALSRTPEIDPFGSAFLLARPLMRALTGPPAVLLIDEVDRADEGFEALLLEYLGEYQITVPEWETVKAQTVPLTVLTSNRQRPLSDALRRRCLYVYLDWPTREREEDIVASHVPALLADVRGRLVNAVHCLREWSLVKPPGLAETVDWARAYVALDQPGWTESFIQKTLGCVLKDAVDFDLVSGRLAELVEPAT